MEALFNGNTAEDVYAFYGHFDTASDLLNWVRKRPVGSAEIYEVEGQDEIVVVITTKSRLGNDSQHCANSIYNGLRIIFVESGEDVSRFNYARNCNIGLKKALRYNPSWIVLSNDDMSKIDDNVVLKQELKKFDPMTVKTLFTNPPGIYHSYVSGIGLSTARREFLLKVSGKIGKMQALVEKRFEIQIVPAYSKFPKNTLTRNNLYFYLTSSFSIFSGAYVKGKGGKVFDELFLNMWEDTDISLEFARDPQSYGFVNYRLADKIGTSFGNTKSRLLRSMVSRAYFNLKHKNLL